MQVHVSELVAFTPGDGAAERSSMFLAGVAAHRASAQSQRYLVVAPSAHAEARVLEVTGDIRSPFACTAGVDAPLATRHQSLEALGRQLFRRTEPQRNGRRGKSAPRAVYATLASEGQ